MSVDNQSVWVVVAAYNEASVIGRVVTDLLRHRYAVVVVDDGSKDDTGRVARAAGAKVVTHPVNLGQGAALQTGIQFAIGNGAEYIVTFDADGQHRVSDAAAMVDRIRDGDLDVVLGSRFLGSATNMPASKRVLLKVARYFEWMSTGVRLTDAHNGLRVFNRPFAEGLRLRMTDMAWASEFLTRVASSHARWAEYPVTIDYTDYSRGKGQRSLNSVNIGVDLLMQRLLGGPH